MKMYGIAQIFYYYTDIVLITDLCNIYQSTSRDWQGLQNIGSRMEPNKETDHVVIIQHFIVFALDFYNGNRSKMGISHENINNENIYFQDKRNVLCCRYG